jgi:4-hydroxy-tetrahydrodipicolinate synthase
MFKPSQLRGTGVAIVTPFSKNGQVDYTALTQLIQHLIKGKVDYLVVLGTTGEASTLSKEEKVKVVNHVVKAANKRVGVVLGLGGNDTQEVIANFKLFDFSGIDAILSVGPYYNKPNQQGLYEHYKLIAKHAPVPVILYNVPGRTACNITAATTLKLAHEVKNIVAVKEASGNLEQIMAIIKNKPKDFLVISGDDLLTLPILACGGDGVISVVANAYPKDFSEMVREALNGNYTKAQRLHYKFTEIIEQLFIDGNPAGIKAVLELLKVTGADVRLPLVKVNAQVQKRLTELAKAYK